MSSLDRRHWLVWLSAAGWEHAAADLTAEQRALVQRWQQHDWPAIVRRRDARCRASEMCIGIAFPPDANGDKLRLSLRVPRTEVRETRAPLLIAEVIEQAPLAWRPALEKLKTHVQAQGLDMRVYGSLALQVLTGETYLRAVSDIDLLFSPADQTQLVNGMALLERYAQALPLDGEVMFPDGAVAWKEWHQVADQPGGRVLLKRQHDVALLLVADVVGALARLLPQESINSVLKE
jgi:phosphoribosyl-dephospho-CoA transferase